MTTIRETRVMGRFKLIELLDKGKFSTVYLGKHAHSNKMFALKLEERKVKMPQIEFESQVLRRLKRTRGIPELAWSGKTGGFNCLVLQKLGKNLGELCKDCGGSFSLKTSLMILDQILSVFEAVHDKFVIHRDIKPENFCVGEDTDTCDQIFMIDFGLAKIYYNERDGHSEFKYGKSTLGKALYASVFSHMRSEVSRRDDLESLIYMILHLTTGSLPWQSIASNSKSNKVLKNDTLSEIKKQFLESKFWKEAKTKLRFSFLSAADDEKNLVPIPEEIFEVYKHIRALEYEERPDYMFYRKQIKKVMVRYNLDYDSVFDWNLLPLEHSIDQSLKNIDDLLEKDYEFSEEEDRTISELIQFYENDGTVIDFELRKIRKQNKKYDVAGNDDDTLEESAILRQIEQKKKELEEKKNRKKGGKKDKDCQLI